MTQEHGTLSHEINRGRVDNIPSKRPSRKRKAPPLGEIQWEQKKPYIEQLYMTEDLPLSEVMRRMGKDHEFFATDKMYKNRFKAWRWSKNIPTAWMAKKAQQRKNDGRDTVFHWNDQRLTADDVVQRNGKAWQNQNDDCSSVICGRTPQDTKYYTPGNERHQRNVSSQPRSSDYRPEEEKFYLDTPPINVELNITTLSQLYDLLGGASRAASAGDFDEAAADFRDAVSGFRFKLSPTHDETLRAAYLYTCFYANLNQMDKSDAILNWMSNHHVKKWGPRHDNAFLHYARMIELFRSWGRQEDAEVLVYKLLDDETNEGVNLLDLVNESSAQRTMSINLDTSFPETDDPQSISQQLNKIDLAMISNINGLDNVLEVIIRHCECKPHDLDISLQACRAKCVLAKWHSNAGKLEQAFNVLQGARRSITPFLCVNEEPMSRTTIQTAKTLAYQFLEMKDESSCNAVLEDVVSSLEARCQVFDCDVNEGELLLDFVLTVGFHFHEVASWDKCRYWVERGYGLAIRMHGIRSLEARRFQKILDKEDFDMRSSISVHDLMKSSGRFFNIRLVSNPASL
ncbi:hypothetical protein KAF25_005913 [Fusarium avenaceum]|uniref:Clr5 domain-containing protein n=1 Tax=Fusarium avenaceum TaxID=40199 RepID=A0A9P7GWC8_9HYPO|nr:hypothetical protein KAF25_005913 [Fusarium avenaceum]